MELAPLDDESLVRVLEQPCHRCGFDAATIERDKLGALVRANAAAWREVLGRGDLVTEPLPTGPGGPPAWSALEHGGYVRDVYRLFEERLRRLLSDDHPRFRYWDQSAAIADGGYRQQDPARVSYELAVTAGKVADMLDRAGDKHWSRTGERADGAEITVESLALTLYHRAVHHLHDAEAGLKALADAREE